MPPVLTEIAVVVALVDQVKLSAPLAVSVVVCPVLIVSDGLAVMLRLGTGFTVSVKPVVAVCPALFVTTTVIRAVPVCPVVGVTVRVRLAPLPADTMLAEATSAVLLLCAVSVMEASSSSATLKLRGVTAAPAQTEVLGKVLTNGLREIPVAKMANSCGPC